MRLLVIDHRDSYSHLLHHLFWSLTGSEPLFVTAERAALEALPAESWDAAILSPGPGHPAMEGDFGATLDFLRRHPHRPMLGVCLGHQGMAHAVGARIGRLSAPRHGKVSRLLHAGEGLFVGLPQGLEVVRYHSLAVLEVNLPRTLQVTARAEDDGSIQALAFASHPWIGLQFHPESIGTAIGPELARRFLDFARLSLKLSAPAEPDTTRTGSRPTPHKERPAREGAPLPSPQQEMQMQGLWPGLAPEALFEALTAWRRSLALAPWVYWLDPDSRAGNPACEGSDMTGEPSHPPRAWPGTRMGFAESTWELYPWGLAMREAKAPFLPLASEPGHPLRVLEARRRASPSPLAWVGHLQYELGALCQDGSAAWAAALPEQQVLGCFLEPRAEWRLDTATSSWTLVARACDRAEAESWCQTLEGFLRRSPKASSHGSPSQPTLPSPGASAWHPSLTREAYRSAFESIQSALHAGDCYEACLTLTARCASAASPERVYAALRRLNPAPFGAYLSGPRATVLSASPELFLAAQEHEGRLHLHSRPIKGTRRRGHDALSDAAQRDELAASAKDRAENLMITDLVRNDFARVCEPGSVHVTSFQALEPHPRVWQMVSGVGGTLRPGLGLSDAWLATFPGGSMTGAPKPRTLNLLRDLEGRPRGIYSGALGLLESDGAFLLAMVIRTLVHEDQAYAAGCGGAIVTDSRLDDEWREAWLKIESLRQAVSLAEGENPEPG